MELYPKISNRKNTSCLRLLSLTGIIMIFILTLVINVRFNLISNWYIFALIVVACQIIYIVTKLITSLLYGKEELKKQFHI